MEVTRDYAGGFGVARYVERPDFGHGRFSLPQVSLMYSAGVLAREGHNIAYVDAQAERLDAEMTIGRVRKLRPEIIVSVVSLPSIYADGYLLRRLRNQNKGSKSICIGTVCKVLPDEVAGMDIADVIVMGEPELILPRLIRNIDNNKSIEGVHGICYIEDGRLRKTDMTKEFGDLREFPWPPHSIMPVTRYRDPHFGARMRFFPVWASRGCSMPCSFYCPYPIGLGKRTRLRPSDDLVDEIEHLYRELGVRAFTFRDQCFSSRLGKAEEICDMIIDRKLKIRWLCETRFDMVSYRLLKKMNRAGCERIHFGLETGDPHLLREIGKPGMKLSTVRNAVKMTRQAGIRPMTHIILGLPGETRRTVLKTLATLRDLGIGKVSINIATPYPGTQLFRYASDHGLIDTRDWSRYTSFSAVMRSESMSTRELEDSRAFLMKHLLGDTLLDKIKYLCKNRAILDFISDKTRITLDDPRSLSPIHTILGLTGRKIHSKKDKES